MGLEEAVVNQATVWPESGADRAAASRENPVLFPAPNENFCKNGSSYFTPKKYPVLFPTPNQYNPNRIFQIGNGFGFFLILLIAKVSIHYPLQARSVCKGLRFLGILAK